MQEFRARCRAFLDIHATGNPEPGRHDRRGDRAMARARRFQRALFDAGLAGLTIPVELGGQGLTDEHERIWREEAAAFPLMTEPLAVSLGNCLSFLVHWGTEEQKARWVRPLLRADAVACQLFSEPDAGSDLANVKARAVRTGDGWRISGQKVWTTYAHLADVGLLLARTSEATDRHDGLSMFLADMAAPGVDIRAIHQIDGAQLFDEVFFDDVPAGPEALVPPEGGGWRLAVELMHRQRLARGSSRTGGITHHAADQAAAIARARGLDHDRSVRDRIARVAGDEMIRSLNALRVQAELAAGKQPGPAGSVAKLTHALFAPRAADLIAELSGPAAMAWSTRPDERTMALGCPDAVAHEVIHSRQYSIAGGTNEIQRNIIAERVLGLPKT